MAPCGQPWGSKSKISIDNSKASTSAFIRSLSTFLVSLASVEKSYVKRPLSVHITNKSDQIPRSSGADSNNAVGLTPTGLPEDVELDAPTILLGGVLDDQLETTMTIGSSPLAVTQSIQADEHLLQPLLSLVGRSLVGTHISSPVQAITLHPSDSVGDLLSLSTNVTLAPSNTLPSATAPRHHHLSNGARSEDDSGTRGEGGKDGLVYPSVHISSGGVDVAIGLSAGVHGSNQITTSSAKISSSSSIGLQSSSHQTVGLSDTSSTDILSGSEILTPSLTVSSSTGGKTVENTVTSEAALSSTISVPAAPTSPSITGVPSTIFVTNTSTETTPTSTVSSPLSTNEGNGTSSTSSTNIPTATPLPTTISSHDGEGTTSTSATGSSSTNDGSVTSSTASISTTTSASSSASTSTRVTATTSIFSSSTSATGGPVSSSISSISTFTTLTSSTISSSNTGQGNTVSSTTASSSSGSSAAGPGISISSQETVSATSSLTLHSLLDVGGTSGSNLSSTVMPSSRTTSSGLNNAESSTASTSNTSSSRSASIQHGISVPTTTELPDQAPSGTTATSTGTRTFTSSSVILNPGGSSTSFTTFTTTFTTALTTAQSPVPPSVENPVQALSSKKKTGAIIGGVLAPVIILLAVGLFVCFCFRRRRQPKLSSVLRSRDDLITGTPGVNASARSLPQNPTLSSWQPDMLETGSSGPMSLHRQPEPFLDQPTSSVYTPPPLVRMSSTPSLSDDPYAHWGTIVVEARRTLRGESSGERTPSMIEEDPFDDQDPFSDPVSQPDLRTVRTSLAHESYRESAVSTTSGSVAQYGFAI